MKRLKWIDVLKGIGMYLVILGHTHFASRGVIYAFHMPLFFLISGMFFSYKKISTKEFVIKK